MRKRLTDKLKFKQEEFIIVVLMMLKNMTDYYIRILYRMALQGELSCLKDVIGHDDIDDSAYELLHAIDDDVFRLTLNYVQKINECVDSFCNINGVVVILDDEADLCKDMDPFENNAVIEASDKIQNRVDKIFNYLVYFKKAKNYRLYLTVLKYYTLSLLQITYCLSQLLDTGKVEAIAIRLKFGRNARFWHIPDEQLFHVAKYKGYNLNFLGHLAQTIEVYYHDLRRLTEKKNL